MTGIPEFDRLHNQARTERDFADLSEWCSRRAREYQVKCALTPIPGSASTSSDAETLLDHYAELALYWRDLAGLYAEKARHLRDPA